MAPSLSTPSRVDIEPYTPPPPSPRCADGIDNGADGLIDFPRDPGCTSAADDDETGGALDTAAPTAKLTGARRQKLARSMAVTVACGAAEDCLASAKGKLSIQGASRAFPLMAAKRRSIARKAGNPRARGPCKDTLRRPKGLAPSQATARDHTSHGDLGLVALSSDPGSDPVIA